MQIVKVTNRNNVWIIRDRFGGIDYEFPPGESRDIPAEAAEHIFGWGLTSQGRWQKFLRMGLANRKDGQKMWDNVLLKAVSNLEPTGAERVAA